MAPSTTTRIVEDIIATHGASARERYFLRQVLHSLIRQARAELMLEIRVNARRLSGSDGGGRAGTGAPRRLPCEGGGTAD